MLLQLEDVERCSDLVWVTSMQIKEPMIQLLDSSKILLQLLQMVIKTYSNYSIGKGLGIPNAPYPK